MPRSPRHLISLGFAVALVVAACGADDSHDAVSTDDTSTTIAAANTPETTSPALTPTPTTAAAAVVTAAPASNSSTSSSTTSTSSTSTTSTSTTSTTSPAAEVGSESNASLTDGSIADVAASASDAADRVGEQIELQTPVFDIGYSVEGRPIVAERVGAAGGRKVLVIGVIHGNEDAGIQIVDELRQRGLDDGIDESVELWLIESMNPDGVVRQDRHNANEVDLNRNFPYKWGMIGFPGNSQYAGPGPASEPETQAAVEFITQLRPDIAIWYHQDANLIIPSEGRDGRIRERYAELLTALPLADCCGGGGVYTGIAATWARNELKKDSDAVPFIVELPGGVLSSALVDAHASAVLTIGVEG